MHFVRMDKVMGETVKMSMPVRHATISRHHAPRGDARLGHIPRPGPGCGVSAGITTCKSRRSGHTLRQGPGDAVLRLLTTLCAGLPPVGSVDWSPYSIAVLNTLDSD
jgi:hypothetical protein